MKFNNDDKYEFSFFESDDSLLNMSLLTQKKESRKRSKSKIKVLLLFLIVIFFLAEIFGEKTKFISILLFGNKDYKRCTLLNKLDLYQYNIKYIFLFIMYSYLNIYSTFCYLVLDIVTNILNDIIRVCFFESRPFWDNDKDVFPCKCELTPSQPSSTSNNSFLFMSLIYFLKIEEKNRNRNRKLNAKSKNLKLTMESEEEENSGDNINYSQYERYSGIGLKFCLIFIIALIIFIDIIPLLQNIEYLHQTLFGLFLGFGIYYWVFSIVQVDHLNKKQFEKIISQPWIIMTFSIILIIIILFIHNNIYQRILIYQIVHIQKFCEISKDFNSSKEILKNCIQLFEGLGAYCGILLEFKITFNSDYNIFARYNIKSKNDECYFEGKGQFIKLIRFLFLYFIEMVFFKTIIEFWIKNNLEGWNQFLSLSFVFFLKGIFFFYIIKIILGKLGLFNEKILEEGLTQGFEE